MWLFCPVQMAGRPDGKSPLAIPNFAKVSHWGPLCIARIAFRATPSAFTSPYGPRAPLLVSRR